MKWERNGVEAGAQPNLTGFDNRLLAVGASSASDIWAVGFDYTGSVTLPLALHCC